MKLAPWKVAQAALAFIQIVRDPNKLDKVFDLRSSLENPALLDPVIAALKSDPRGAAAFRDFVRVGRIDLATLEQLPDGTLGREHARNMRAQNLDPAALPRLPSDTQYQYVSAHLYETHDLWHTVTGFGTDVVGELGLQAFYYAQFPSGLSAMLLAAGFMNTTLFRIDERIPRMDAIVEGYALGKKADKLFGLRWAELWARPLSDVRRELGITPVRRFEVIDSIAA